MGFDDNRLCPVKRCKHTQLQCSARAASSVGGLGIQHFLPLLRRLLPGLGLVMSLSPTLQFTTKFSHRAGTQQAGFRKGLPKPVAAKL